jgi:hypothetical protein
MVGGGHALPLATQTRQIGISRDRICDLPGPFLRPTWRSCEGPTSCT